MCTVPCMHMPSMCLMRPAYMQGTACSLRHGSELHWHACQQSLHADCSLRQVVHRWLSRQLTLPCCRPRICLMALISALPLICVTLASRTFSSLPLRAGMHVIITTAQSHPLAMMAASASTAARPGLQVAAQTWR